MVRTSLPEMDTACLHPEIEEAMIKWLKTRSHPAFLLIGSPGIGKTTNDFAGVIIDTEADRYGLRYNEFIAPIIKAIQELNDRLKAVEEVL